MVNETKNVTGTIFDRKEFTVHDGPGVRTTVFFKGCPLSCIWCHNPEGMDVSPTLMVRTAQCTDCGLCRRGCSHADCQPFHRCLHICPRGLIQVAGHSVSAGELVDKLSAGAMLYEADENGICGGVTLSGGEPLLQPDFACAVAGGLHENGIHTALQTCGYAKEETFRRVLDAVDYVLFDLKLASDEEHRRYTGVSCKPIHKNLAVLRASGKPYVLRIPLIPGITDSVENLTALAAIAGDDAVELMPYNPYAGAKYPMTGKKFMYREQNGRDPMEIAGMFRNARILR
ncbi:MAG: glycyl-radical enzyme activating protein [Eubacteriales bacterium]